MFELTNKIALVTGAKQGMGKAHALALAAQGATVILTNRNDNCQTVVDDIVSKGGQAAGYAMDVTQTGEIEHVFSEIDKIYGRLDILVNNAGIFVPKPALEITEKDWDEMLDINLKGQFLCAQKAAKLMSKNKWGRIINISSIASGSVGVGFLGAAHYTASKGGVVGMTETLASEWAPLGINVNVIAPGAIDTPMVRNPGTDLDEVTAGLIKSRIPLRRIGRADEVAVMAVFLASEESSYVTGATFFVDGGWLAN